MRAHRGLPKNKALIKFLSEQGIKAVLQKTENFYMQDQNKEMPKADAELYFVIDEKSNSVELTDKGVDLIRLAICKSNKTLSIIEDKFNEKERDYWLDKGEEEGIG